MSNMSLFPDLESAQAPVARTGNAVQVYSGRFVWPLDLRPEDITLEDIAHSLAFQCRYNGHTRRYYSVAEHSVLMSCLVPEEHRQWALMHDASEAYLSDIPRPIKKNLQFVYSLEKQMEEAIAAKFGLPYPMPEAIREYDNRMLAAEAPQLLLEPEGGWKNSVHWFGPGEWPKPFKFEVNCWQPAVAEMKFIERFGELFNGRDARGEEVVRVAG